MTATVDNESDRTLTAVQVARRFNVSRTTVAKWADAGHLPSFRTPGGQRRFLESDIDAYIADQSTHPSR